MEAGYSRLIVWAVQTNSIICKAFLELRYHIGVCCESTDSVCSLERRKVDTSQHELEGDSL